MKLISIVGARPQFVKAWAVHLALQEAAARHSAACVEHLILHTGQHYDKGLSGVFFEELDLPEPKYQLGVGSGTHGGQTARMLEGIEEIVLKEGPDAALVYGDTNSTLAGALAVAKLPVPLVHVEAGVRSGNREMPEELNRIATDHLSDWLLCPTQTAVDNLCGEGLSRGVELTGDVMLDALQRVAPALDEKAAVLDEVDVSDAEYYVATVHRAENVDRQGRLLSIVEALGELASRSPVVLSLHPRTRKRAEEFGIDFPPGVHAVPPVPYREMLRLQKHSAMVLTDSGGVQREAYYLGVPCLVLRTETEWPETLQPGLGKLAGVSRTSILAAAAELMAEKPTRQDISAFGGGEAGQRIADLIYRVFVARS